MELNVVKSGTWGTCLWGIDDTGFLLIGEGTGASINREEDAPWHDMRSIITEVKFVGNVNMPENSALRAAFKDCKLLTAIDASTFDTYQVVDMGSLFENCTMLKELSLTSFDTTNVKNMNKMFCGCRQLSNLDLSSFSTVEVVDMHDMFAKCNKLHNITLGDRFSTVGNGQTSCGNLAIRDTGRYRMAKVVDVIAGMVFYHSNDKANKVIGKQSITGFRYTIDDNSFQPPRQECKFLEWNTKSDGKGESYMPGDEIEHVDEDIDLFAIWVAPPLVGTLEQPPEIAYGSPIKFNMPEIFAETDDPITGYLEISPNGKERTWKQIEHTAILPTSYDGYMMRLAAYNDYGIAYSNPVRLRIRKAELDFSKVYWAEERDMSYNGNHKWVWLEGLPEGVKASYEGNCGIDAGTYTALVTLDYDKENYDTTLKIKPYSWEIKKAKYDMSAVKWNYETAFRYDGQEKSVCLTGLPEGVMATYENNVGTNVDIRTAFATFTYDETNYEKPADITPCVWEIKKAYIDANTLEWSSSENFVYNGEPQKVYITNLPDGATVEYYGNEEAPAGKYLARAVLSDNFYTNGPIEHEWEIKKARYNMATVHWNYDQPFTYDKAVHEVGLVNIPNGLTVRYLNHIGMESGDYHATATFVCQDAHNYETPQDINLTWSIKKAVLDLSEATWNYNQPFEYDGGTHSVELVGLPEEVYAVIDNGSASRAGIYIAHANLKYDENNYEVEQPADCQWQINKAKYDISNVRWSYTHPFIYDGEEKVVNLINIPDGLNVEYQNNVMLESGKYVATAKLTPSDPINFEIPIVNGCTWAINKSVLDKIDIVWSDDSGFVYDGTEKSMRIISDINDKMRIEYSGADEINAGEHEAIATFYSVDANNYEAPTPIHHRWSIQKSHFDIAGVVWDYTTNFTYDGTKKEVKLINVPDGLVVNYENNQATEVGEYTAVARFEVMDANNYYPLDSIELRWSIQKATYDLSNTRWQDETTFAYDETAKKVELTGLPQGLIPNYVDNFASAAGEYLARVEFAYDEHNYEKPTFVDCRWKIEKSSFSIGSARWDYEEPFVYDGTEKTVKVVYMPDGASVEYASASAVNAGVYTASANVYADDINNYMHTKMPDLVWRIEKGNYDMSKVHWDYDRAFTYDGTEKRIVLKGLPEGVEANYIGNVGVEAGTYNASVTFKVADPDNYNVPVVSNCIWEIGKTDYDMSNVKWDYSGAFTYDGRMQEISLIGLPNGVRATYEGNCGTTVGHYTATASFQIYDNVNYNVPKFEGCNWEIVKADYDMSMVSWNKDVVKTYSGSQQGIYLENLPNGVYAEYTGNEATEVGHYTANAILKVADPASFNTPAINGCDWDILKADLDMSDVNWDFVTDSFVYDGTPKKIALQNLPEFVYANYTGETATNAGTYTATAEFVVNSPNYNTPETISYNWYINKAKCDMSNVKWDYKDEYVYDARPHGIEVYGLPENVTVSYDDNRMIDAGTYIAVAKFSTDVMNYEIPDEMSCQWSIVKANCDISSIRWDYDQSFTYDGIEKQVNLVGVPDTLYVNYYGNSATDAGQYVATAEFTPVDTNNYNTPESISFDWEILKATFDLGKTVWSSNKTFVYSGETQAVVVDGYPEGIRPIYSGNTATEVGSYHAEVAFEYDEYNYNEPRILGCDWSITKSTFDMSSAYWDYSQAFTYDGSEKSVVLRGLPEGVKPIYKNNAHTDAGEYYAEVSFAYDTVNYEEPRFDGCIWMINKTDIPVEYKKLSWTYNQAFTYDGTPHGVKLRTEVEDISFLDKLRGYEAEEHLAGIPSGFEVVYADNIRTDAGVYYAKATIKPLGNDNYNALELPEFRWEIRKATVDMSEVRWDYNRTLVFDGEEKSIELIGLPSTVIPTYTGNVAIKAGLYEAQVSLELADTINYEQPESVRGCLWKIDKVKIDTSDIEWNYEGFTYDGEEKTVEVCNLPEGVKVVGYRGNTAVDAGMYTAEVMLTVEDTENYEVTDVKPLRWKIDKQKIDADGMFWNYSDGSLFVYDDQIKEVSLVGIPDGVEAVYINNRKINAGTYVAKARLVYDNKNYVIEEVPDLVWRIEKASFDTSITYWDYDGPFQFDGHEKKITLKNLPNHIEVRYMDNRATAIGSYTAKAYLSYNTDNFKEPDIPRTIEWEIVR